MLWAVLVASSFLAFRAQTAAADRSLNFFVATNGNDSWSGQLAAPNRGHRDGPLATLKKAFESARVSHPAGAGAGTATVFVREGIYFLTEPLLLTSADRSLNVEAYKNEKPVISGGRKIGGWKEAFIEGKHLWAAEIPEVREGKWFFHELWVNGRRATRARHPNHGYLNIAEVPDATPQWEQGQTRFRFKAGDIPNSPSITNAEVVAMSRWVESRLPILSIDEKERLVTFAKKSVFQLAKDDPYYLEHSFEALDEAGEWYLDRGAGKLFYWPRPGEKIERIEAIAPVLTQLIRVEGHSEAKAFIQSLTFKGITFSHNEWYFPEGFASAKDKPDVSPPPRTEIGGFSQAAIGVPAAVTLIAARNCRFEHCAFSHIGSYALELGRGCQSNLVSHCELFDLAAGGLKIGETRIPEKAEDQARANNVIDCRIYEGGRVFHSAIGVWIGQSSENRIEHNLIHDFYYTGISMGWTWGYGPSAASNNLVAFNHVHHIGVESDGDGPILSDMGGIYTLGKEPGTKIINNLWHDIAGIHYGGWGIYLDEGSSGILVESNLVYRTTHGGFHQHYGETNLIRNNIFAFARDHQLQRSRVEPHSSFSFETNIIYFDTGVLLGGAWDGDQYLMDHNVYWDARLAPDKADLLPIAGGISLEQWRKRGHDQHSIVADPLFVNPRSNDFRLRPDSPGFTLGFHAIDLSGIGPLRTHQ